MKTTADATRFQAWVDKGNLIRQLQARCDHELLGDGWSRLSPDVPFSQYCARCGGFLVLLTREEAREHRRRLRLGGHEPEFNDHQDQRDAEEASS